MEILKPYLQNLCNVASHGDTREESFYPALKGLLDDYAKSIKKDADVTSQPKKTEAGNPDFRIWDGKQHIVGYIEAKEPNIDLDKVINSQQLKRYLGTFPNLILTNFLEFRLFRNGEPNGKCSIGFSIAQIKLNDPLIKEREQSLIGILDKFFSFSLPSIDSDRGLAIELAKRTRFLRDEVIAEELKEEKGEKGSILGLYGAFKKHLIGDLTKEEFADLYSQTITYGLFIARTKDGDEFNRKLAYDRIPPTLGLLREIFSSISTGKIPSQMEWIIDDISEVLTSTDIGKIFAHAVDNLTFSFIQQDYDFRKSKDLIFHFYETFLAEYDPSTRRKTGSYYTPEPVVAYIVRSLNYVLKRHLKKPDGFADSSVTVLDPAAGTLTFLYYVIRLALEEFTSKYGKGGRANFIRDHVLNNFFAFELKMAPYAIGHLRLSYLLEEGGYKLKGDDRLKFYLTNALEMQELSQSDLLIMSSLSEESHLANEVKTETPILVILGNPPYFGRSSNFGDWISKEIREYYQVDGHPLNEKNPKWLQDDYVKFIRFAQWKIDQAGEGVLGFITNHGYLDNPTFRGMRQSLMKSFDEIYILDLHGNSLKKEKCPDGSKDENVFDIMQGVAISIFIKRKNGSKDCKVYHSELWGTRESKYSWLMTHDKASTDWKELSPKSEFYLFIPRDENLSAKYENYPQITDIFPLNGVGMTTARDNFFIDHDRDKLLKRVKNFKNSVGNDDELHKEFKINKKEGWSIRKAWDMLQPFSESELNDLIVPVLYRPFDIRWIFYHDSLVWRTVKRVMNHMLEGYNLALITARSNKSNKMDHFFCSDKIMETKCGESTTQSCLFPIYLYSDDDIPQKQPNINSRILDTLSEIYEKEPTPEEILYYIYAVLYSNTYRKKYAEFLRIDFPRVPFTKDYKLFSRMAGYGKRLIALHLLESDELDPPIARYQGEGDDTVEKPRYDESNGYIYVNKDRYFEGVNKEVWAYHIGGYQVCDKWLKDRKGRHLSLDEMKHYCRIVTALQKTIEIQGLIDGVYPEVEREVMEFGI
jgi:hypothetical protein